MQYPEPIAKLIDSYMKLPGIGEKTATRLAFYTLGMDQKDVEDFAKSLLSVKKRSALLQHLWLYYRRRSLSNLPR